MRVARDGEAHRLKHLDVYRQRREPLVGADYVGRAHEVVVDDVGEVVRRQSVALNDNEVEDVLLHGDVAAQLVMERAERAELSVTLQADDIGLARLQLFEHALVRLVTPDGPLAEVSLLRLTGLLLLLTQSLQLLLAAEARIGEIPLDEISGVGLIDLPAQGLAVGAVATVVLRLVRGALVEADVKVAQRGDDLRHAALDLALLVGVLDAQEEHAVLFTGDETVQQRRIQPADVHEARGAGGEARGARGGARRILRLELRGRFRDVGEKRVSDDFAHVITDSLY